MYLEYEVRVLDINKEEFIKKLESFNATYVNDYYQIRYVYDFNPVLSNKWIRLRTNGITTTLAVKEYRSKDIGGTKELEIEVSDLHKTDLILEELGYKKRSIQENKRTRYILDDVEIDIDTWPRLNTYVEFEGKNKEDVLKVIKKLGYTEDDITTMDAQDIYLSCGYTQDDLNDLHF